MEIHNKDTNLRESGEWEDYTDGIDNYSPEMEAQQEVAELEKERFDSLSLAGQIAEVSGGNVEDIQVLLDEAAENDYPNQVVLETLQETLGISEDDMINKVLPILRNHGFEGDYSADHYDVDYPEEETVIFEEGTKKNSKKRVKEAYNYVSDKYESCIDHFCNTHGNLEVNYDREYDSEKDADVEFYQFFLGDPEEEKYINVNLWYSDTEGECYVIGSKHDDFEGHDPETFAKDLEKAYNNLNTSEKMTEAYSANRGSASKSYAELHPEAKENMREGVNTISFNKTDKDSVEVTFDTDDGVHTENYDIHTAVGIAKDWLRKDYVCKVNGKPVDDPTIFDDLSDEGEMTCTAPWFECSPKKSNRMTEAYSANRGSATKSYAELHPETAERMKEASYQKFELPKKATPGDKEYNPDEPGKKPAKRDWTSGKMKSVNGIYGRRAWEIKKPKTK